MIEFAFPFSTGEWFAWIVALISMLYGFCLMFMPRFILALEGLVLPQEGQKRSNLSAVRGPYGGLWLGLGLSCILLAQPLVYLSLGLCFVMVVVGRLYSFLVDRVFSIMGFVLLVLDFWGAFFPIAYAFQLIA